MQKTEPLQYGRFYHIYNCGINGETLYREEADYLHFLQLYDKYIEPVAGTYAWVLLGNHFHLLIQVKENMKYKYSKPSNDDGSVDAVMFEEVKWETVDLPTSAGHGSVKRPKASKHFAHLFNAYAKYYNIKYKRHGSLFERAFKRKLVSDDNYLKQLILYIHNNPVHHGFCSHSCEYTWSSYQTCISTDETKLKRKEVLEWFDDMENFKTVHDEKADLTLMENWLGLHT